MKRKIDALLSAVHADIVSGVATAETCKDRAAFVARYGRRFNKVHPTHTYAVLSTKSNLGLTCREEKVFENDYLSWLVSTDFEWQIKTDGKRGSVQKHEIGCLLKTEETNHFVVQSMMSRSDITVEDGKGTEYEKIRGYLPIWLKEKQESGVSAEILDDFKEDVEHDWLEMGSVESYKNLIDGVFNDYIHSPEFESKHNQRK